MLKFKQSLAALVGLSVLIGLIALATPRTTRGQGGSNQQPLNVRVIEQPLSVRTVETPRQAFHQNFSLTFDAGKFLAFGLYRVPAGKQLVLTHASASVEGRANISFAIQVVTSSSMLATHQLVPVAAGPIRQTGLTGEILPGPNSVVASQPLNLYVDAGQSLIGLAIRDEAAGATFGDIYVSGYLVDVP